MPNADISKTKLEIKNLLGSEEDEIIATSSKTGEGSIDVLDAIVERIPAPEGDVGAALKALIFDSKYDPYKGVVVYIRVIDGCLKLHDKIKMMNKDSEYEVEEIGIFAPQPKPVKELTAGLVGFIAY